MLLSRRGFNRTDTADGNSLGALFYYTNVVYSVSVIGSDVDLADVAGQLKLMCRKPPLFILSRFIHQGFVYYISGERGIKSKQFLGFNQQGSMRPYFLYT